MSGLNDWMELSGAQQLAILQEDLEARLAARHRRDAERALRFAPRTQLSPLDPPAAVNRCIPLPPVAPAAAGGSIPFSAVESVA